MLTKKSVVILVIIAIILAGIAITTQLSDSEEISTTRPPITGNSIKGGEVGVKIIQPPIEDKLAAGEQS